MTESAGHPNVLYGRAPTTEQPTSVLVDATARALYTGMWVWNDSTLVWEKSTKAREIYGYNGTNWHELRIDTSTRTAQTIEYEHHEIHGGSHYFVVGYLDLAINHVLDMQFTMPNTTKWIHWNFHIMSESEANWFVYEGATATNPLANAFTPLNSNRNSDNTSGTTLLYEDQATLAAANVDTDVSGATTLMSGICGAGKDAGEDTRSHEVILKQNTVYCLRSIATAAGYINFDMHWYEHTDKAV